MTRSRLLETDRERIERAVRDAERHTSGEIVVAVVRACDEYGSAGWRCGVLLAALALLGVGLVAPPLPLSAYFGAQLLALGLGHLLARLDPVRRRFVSERLLAERAEQRAQATFAERGLRFTAQHTGILIFVALFEHRVIVLADRGIDRALGPGENWDEIVDRVLAGVRRGALADGIVDAVKRCGEILAHPLPPSDDAPDELPQALFVED
jgi:putative membrane protein